MTREALKLRLTDDGLHLADSILWLDSHFNGELSFLSSASVPVNLTVPQVIATEETVRILEAYKKKPNALVCQYNRPFSIGRLRMELLPSGSVLGGASLYIETDKGKLLYAPCLQPNSIPTVRKMQVKRANSLILGAFYPDPTVAFPNRKKEKERLSELVRKLIAKNEYPVILCDPVSIAQEITKHLCEEGFPVTVHPAINKINRVYESFGSNLGDYSIFSKRHNPERILILPKTMRAPFAQLGGPVPIISIEDSISQIPARGIEKAFPTRVVDAFFMSSHCDGPELRAIVSLVNPKELYFFGPYAKRYCEEFEGLAPKLKPLFANDQPTLF